jgi:hypothetical protein
VHQPKSSLRLLKRQAYNAEMVIPPGGVKESLSVVAEAVGNIAYRTRDLPSAPTRPFFYRVERPRR